MAVSDDSDGAVINYPRSRPKAGLAPSVISELLKKPEGRQEPETTHARREPMGRSVSPVRQPEEPGTEDVEEEEAANTSLPSIDELIALPKPNDDYKAYARPYTRPLPTLVLLLHDGTRRSFPWSGRVGGPDWLDTPEGIVIVLRFADVVPMEVLLPGRNFDELFDGLTYHKIAWVRALAPGKMIADRTLPVVTNIVVRPWKPPEPAADAKPGR